MTQDKCICIENITDLMLSNASECMTSCQNDSNDMCGAEGRIIVHEIGKINLESRTLRYSFIHYIRHLACFTKYCLDMHLLTNLVDDMEKWVSLNYNFLII